MAKVDGTSNALAVLLESESTMKIVTEKLGYTLDEVLGMNVFQVRDLLDKVERYVG